jgi:DNA primase
LNSADRVRDAIDIVQVIGEVVNLKKQGHRYSGLCPFHSEKSPSFTVSSDKQLFHCFGCKAGGNVFTFVQKYYHWDFPQALEELAKKAGVELDDRPADRDRDEMFRIMEVSSDFFAKELRSKSGEASREYLVRRRVPEALWEEFRLGAHPGGATALADFLKEKGFNLEVASRLGLVGLGRSGDYLDRYRSRLLFPLADDRGRIRGFGARALGDEMPKYINSPNSPIFDKKQLLYGMGIAISSGALARQNYVVLVEGYLDVIALHEFGVRTAVGTMGTALTSEQLRAIKRRTHRVISLFDADTAGVAATAKGLELYLAEGLEAKVAIMPAAKDPDAFLHDESVPLETRKSQLRDLFKNAKPALDYLIEKRVLAEQDSIRRAKAVRSIADLLEKVPDLVERQMLQNELGQRFSISLASRQKDFEPLPRASGPGFAAQRPQKRDLGRAGAPRASVVREVLKFLVLFGKSKAFGLTDLLPYLSFSPLSPMAPEDERWAKVLGELIRKGYDSTALSHLDWLESIDSESQAEIREWILQREKELDSTSSDREWSEVGGQWKVLERKLKQAFFGRQSRKVNEALRVAESEKDSARARELLMEKQALIEMMKDFSDQV